MKQPERWIVIPSWHGKDGFQHYRDRDPIWIKNYTRLIADENYTSLTLAQRGILHGLWLLYARHSEVLSEARARHLLTTTAAEARHWRDNIEALNHAGFLTLTASKPLAQRYRHASPEKEEEEIQRSSGTALRGKARPEEDQDPTPFDDDPTPFEPTNAAGDDDDEPELVNGKTLNQRYAALAIRNLKRQQIKLPPQTLEEFEAQEAERAAAREGSIDA